MIKYSIVFLPSNISVNVPEGRTLLDAQRLAGLSPDAPCGGLGTCGKCKVEIKSGKEPGIFNACQIKVDCDMVVSLPNANSRLSVLTAGEGEGLAEAAPKIRCVSVTVEKGRIGDHRSDWERLCGAVSKAADINAPLQTSVNVIADLNTLLCENEYHISVILFENEVIDICAHEKTVYALAYDIGTTTIACYLLNCSTGETAAMAGAANPQIQFGADVISRSMYAKENGTYPLTKAVRETMDSLAKENIRSAAITADDVYLASIVGNTCMHHLFAGIFPGSLITAPYTPVIRDALILDAKDHLSNMNSSGKLMLLPIIAGFIGADTVGAMLATQIDQRDKLTLILDMGTNGEIVLGNKNRRIACSAASGPAFEGAQISCGMRSVAGAIDRVWVEDGRLRYTTIGDEPPLGLCGSGIIDAISALLDSGIILPSGRFQSAEKLKGICYDDLIGRLKRQDSGTVFILAGEQESENGSRIYLSQKDIREVQLAKSAVACGIKLLAEVYGIQLDEIQEILVARAFCAVMNPKSICNIGLIPMALVSKIRAVGNAAGMGAKLAAINSDAYEKSKTIARDTEFLELVTHPEFQSRFIRELDFERQ